MIQLFTDSTSDLTGDFLEKYNIKILPYLVILGDKTYTSEPTWKITPKKEFMDFIDRGGVGKISRPSMGEWMNILNPYLEKGDDILFIPSAAKVSGVFSTFNIMINLLKDQYPERTIKIVDSKAASAGLKNILLDFISIGDLNPDNHRTTAICSDPRFIASCGRFPELDGNTKGYPWLDLEEDGSASVRKVGKTKEEIEDGLLEWLTKINPEYIAFSFSQDCSLEEEERIYNKYKDFKILKERTTKFSPHSMLIFGPNAYCVGLKK